eukprot:jgi/Mesen1/3158/ME000184S02223
MVWCGYCGRDQPAEVDETNGFTCCTGCGRVLDDTVYSTDVTFSKGAGGVSQADGNFVSDGGGGSSFGRLGNSSGGRVFGYQSDSHEKTVLKGKHEIVEIAERLGIRPREDMTNAALRLYRRNFTRGRRTQQVAGACLYIVCRQEKKPYMLIDFSDCLMTNVFVLGAVFLQLCRLLHLEQHPLLQAPIDPSLFIHRFSDRLDFGRKMHAVAATALRLVASMKRDWLQTGRRPSGICGAALFVAAHIHGFERSKRDVVDEFETKAKEIEQQQRARMLVLEASLPSSSSPLALSALSASANALVAVAAGGGDGLLVPAGGEGAIVVGGRLVPPEMEAACQHCRTGGAAAFAHGLCRLCYEQREEIRAAKRAEGNEDSDSGTDDDGDNFDEDDEGEEDEEEEELDSDIDYSDEEWWDTVPVSHLLRRIACQPGPSGRGSESAEGAAGRGTGRGRGGWAAGDGEGGEQHQQQAHVHVAAMAPGKRAAHDRLEEELEAALECEEMAQIAMRTVPPASLLAASRPRRPPQTNAPGGGDSSHLPPPAASAPPLEVSSLASAAETVAAAQVRTAAPGLRLLQEESGEADAAGSGGSGGGSVMLLESSPSVACVSSERAAGEQPTAAAPAAGGAAPPPLALEAPPPDDPVGLVEVEAEEEAAAEEGEEEREEEEKEDTLSDIDDDEVKPYLLKDEEVRLKTILWTEINKDFLAAQEAKAAALAETEAAHAAAVAAAEASSASAADVAAAAAAAIAIMKRKVSSKVNYAALANLFSADALAEEAAEERQLAASGGGLPPPYTKRGAGDEDHGKARGGLRGSPWGSSGAPADPFAVPSLPSRIAAASRAKESKLPPPRTVGAARRGRVRWADELAPPDAKLAPGTGDVAATSTAAAAKRGALKESKTMPQAAGVKRAFEEEVQGDDEIDEDDVDNDDEEGPWGRRGRGAVVDYKTGGSAPEVTAAHSWQQLEGTTAPMQLQYGAEVDPEDEYLYY